MTVQELFKDIDRELFITKYLEYCGEPKSAKRKNKIRELLNIFDSISITPNKSLIIFCMPIFGEHYLSSTVIKDVDLINTEVENGEVPEGYAYEFTCMTEILSYTVSSACIYAFGAIKCACSILYEMTFFGYDIDEQRKTVEQETEQMHKAIEETHNNTANLVSFEDLRKKYGWTWTDDRKDFEKDFDNNILYIECELSRKLKLELCKLEISYLFENV